MKMHYCNLVIAQMEHQLGRIKRGVAKCDSPEEVWEAVLRGMAAIQSAIAIRLSDAILDTTEE